MAHVPTGLTTPQPSHRALFMGVPGGWRIETPPSRFPGTGAPLGDRAITVSPRSSEDASRSGSGSAPTRQPPRAGASILISSPRPSRTRQVLEILLTAPGQPVARSPVSCARWGSGRCSYPTPWTLPDHSRNVPYVDMRTGRPVTTRNAGIFHFPMRRGVSAILPESRPWLAVGSIAHSDAPSFDNPIGQSKAL